MYYIAVAKSIRDTCFVCCIEVVHIRERVLWAVSQYIPAAKLPYADHMVFLSHNYFFVYLLMYTRRSCLIYYI